VLALGGLRVVVTRAAHQAEPLAALLRKHGSEPILLPVIGIGPPLDPEPLGKAAAHTNDYDWILFTSANAVAGFSAVLPHPAGQCRARVAAIGPATGAAARERGFTVDLVPDAYVAESLVAVLGSENLEGRRVLIPSAAVTRDVVPAALREQGAYVDVVVAYRNVIPPGAADEAPRVFQEPYPEWVTFASSSAVDNLVSLIGAPALRQTNIASIGPVTSETIRKHALVVVAEAPISTLDALVKAICQAAEQLK
jgi:uroporphyrinogen-III synthase